MKSKFLNLAFEDWMKGLLMAILGAFLTSLYTIIESGEFPSSWEQVKPILLTSIGAGLAYLIKNFFTNSKNEIAKGE